MSGRTREAGDGIKSRTPAEMLGRGPRPGVERSGTPGAADELFKARGAAESGIIVIAKLKNRDAVAKCQVSNELEFNVKGDCI